MALHNGVLFCKIWMGWQYFYFSRAFTPVLGIANKQALCADDVVVTVPAKYDAVSWCQNSWNAKQHIGSTYSWRSPSLSNKITDAPCSIHCLQHHQLSSPVNGEHRALEAIFFYFWVVFFFNLHSSCMFMSQFQLSNYFSSTICSS